jgi:decaprenylphospho-beta-D-erythro-pentofuranosid-2-ulose 2-reductase
MQNTILIVGASSSMARAIAAKLASGKNNLLLAGRNVDDLQKTARDLEIRHDIRAQVVRFDALDLDSHPAFVEECLEHADGVLKGVVLCHGYMADQAEAQEDFRETRKMIDTNFTSAVSILNLLANHFEKRQEGFICAVSSVAGDRGRGSNYLYGSTKAALNAYLQGLRNRLAKVKVPVLTVKPGFVDTRMTWGLPKLFLVASPDRVATDICRAIDRRKNIIYTPWFWWGIMSIICSIPEPVFKKLKL